MLKIRALLVAIIISLGAHAHPVLAHSKMAKSVPENGATAKAGLTDVTLGFSKPVRVTIVKVKRTDKPSDIAVVKKAKPVFTDSYSVEVTPLEPGAYDVDWTAVAKDGHVMKGKLSFKIEP